MSENDKKTTKTNSNKSINEKMIELSTIVAWFQSEDFVLEEAIDKYTQAQKMANDIEKSITELKNDIEVVKQRFDREVEQE